MKYQSLNDAPNMAPGSTEVWYMKPWIFRDLRMGIEYCPPDLLPTKSDLGRTHILLGSVAETDLEVIFMNFQGENWSPNGEANELIRSLSLRHTSMSVGDIVVCAGVVSIVAPMGFVQL